MDRKLKRMQSFPFLFLHFLWLSGQPSSSSSLHWSHACPPPSNLPLPSNGHMVVEQPVVSAPGRQWAPGFRLGCAAVCALQASAHCVVHPSLALLELCVGSLRLGLFSAEQGAFKGKVNRSNQQIGLPPLWITRNSCWWFLNFSWTFLGKTFY